MSGSRLDPQTAAVTITGAGPAGRARPATTTSRRRSAVVDRGVRLLEPAPLLAPPVQTPHDRRSWRPAADGGSGLPGATSTASAGRSCERPDATPWDLGADELPATGRPGPARRGTCGADESGPARPPCRLAMTSTPAADVPKEDAMRTTRTGTTRRRLPQGGRVWAPPGPSAAGGLVDGLGRGLLRARGPGGHHHARPGRAPTATSRCPGRRRHDPLYIFGFIPVSPTADASSQLDRDLQGPRPAHGADPRLPAERRHQDHADQPRAGPAARPDRLAHHPLARLRRPVAAQRRRAGGVGRACRSASS